MPKVKDLPSFTVDPPKGLIVHVEPYLFFYKKGKIRSHHDPKAKILLKANIYITEGRFAFGGKFGSHGCRVERRAAVEIDVDDPNSLSEFKNGTVVRDKLRSIMQGVFDGI